MNVTITSTSKVVQLNCSFGNCMDVPARIWEGVTDSGIKVHCFITRIACDKHANQEQFQRELTEVVAPSGDVEVYPLRMVL